MLKMIFVGVTALLFAVFVPVYLLEPVPEPHETPYLLIIRQEPSEDAPAQTLQINLKTENGVIMLPLEEYLIGVVISEMPASFAPEALKAQAVAARTFTLRQMENSKHEDCDLCSDSACCQAWTSRSGMEDKLGDSFSLYWKKAEEAVRATEGQGIYYKGTLIDAVYFSCSGGKTEAAVEVWGNDIPYLKSVDSPGEENARVYSSRVSVPLDQFIRTLQNADSSVSMQGSPAAWFGPVKKTDGGGVQTMQIGGVAFSGTTLRQLFGLRSTNFSVSVTEDAIRFDVIGYGHRVGMSQYGANAMAQAGKNYIEILQYYYTGVTIEKHP